VFSDRLIIYGTYGLELREFNAHRLHLRLKLLDALLKVFTSRIGRLGKDRTDAPT
jgi:hypothetical protein